jgi:hypothetical protein
MNDPFGMRTKRRGRAPDGRLGRFTVMMSMFKVIDLLTVDETCPAEFLTLKYSVLEPFPGERRKLDEGL